MSTAPIEHVPADQTDWIYLGSVSTENCPFAIVSAFGAAGITQEWDRRIDASYETFNRSEQDELLMSPGSPQVVQVQVSYPWQGIEGKDDAILFAAPDSPDTGVVEGRFGDLYGSGHMKLIEIRVRLWKCQCVCHEDDQDDETVDRCDGHCCLDDDDA
jgi:hypothetical protein